MWGNVKTEKINSKIIKFKKTEANNSSKLKKNDLEILRIGKMT